MTRAYVLGPMCVLMLAGCGGDDAQPASGTVAVERIDGAPTDAEAEREVVALAGEAAALSLLAGSIAVAVGDGVQRLAADAERGAGAAGGARPELLARGARRGVVGRPVS